MVDSRKQPMQFDPSVDQRVWPFAFGLSLVTGILFGIAPATDPNLALKAGSSGRGARRWTLRNGLIAVQVAVSVVVVTGVSSRVVDGLFVGVCS